MELFIRALIFYLGLALAAIICFTLALFLLPLPFRQRYQFITQWSEFALWWLKTTCRLSYQLHGQSNIPEQPVIVLSKHQSAWETIALTRLFLPQCWVLKRELLWVPFFGWSLAMLKPIAINRGSPRRAIQQVVKQGKQRLAQGIFVVIFPEGTRVAPGERGRYGIGGAWLAAESGYSVVPVAHNAGKFWPPHGFLKYPGTIQIHIGPAIDSKDKTAQEINTLVETWIEGKILEIN